MLVEYSRRECVIKARAVTQLRDLYMPPSLLLSALPGFTAGLARSERGGPGRHTYVG